MHTTAGSTEDLYALCMVDLWSLRILVEVADRGSFSGAGDALALSQPAVSRQVGALERRFGTRLFRRVPRGVVLTGAGATAVEHARAVLAAADAFDAALRAEATASAGHVRLAAFASANSHLVPEALRRFADDHPGVTSTLVHVDPFEALDAVADGSVDVALVTSWQLHPDPARVRVDPRAATGEPAAAARVELVPLLDEELRLALPADHPQAGRRAVRLRDLRGEAWVEGAFPDCLGPLSQLVEAMGAPPRIDYTCHDWNGKQALVATGAGVMLVPTLAEPSLRRGIVVRPVTPRLPGRRLYAAVARPPDRSAAADALAGVLLDLAAARAQK